MSKIFDAYKKAVREPEDLRLAINRSGSVELFPRPRKAQLEDFSKLANRILGLRRQGEGIVLAFAASASGEGASFVSYNLASLLAATYQSKVAWVDANYLSPQDKLVGLDAVGLDQLLQRPEDLEFVTDADNPRLVPTGRALMGARGLFADKRYFRLLEAFRQRFDFTILDLPPILATNDTALMAKGTDGLLLVIEQRFLKWEVIEHGVEGLRDKGVDVLGSVINRRSFELPNVIYKRL